jgi:hypothetical protein
MRSVLRSVSLASVALLAGAVPVVSYNWTAVVAYAQSTCWPSVLPVGQSTVLLQSEPQQPVWCVALGPEPLSRVSGDNSWLDDFKTGVMMGSFEDGEGDYRIFHNAGASTYQDRYFRNQNHWMIDIAGFGPDGYGNCSGRGDGNNPNPGGCYNVGNTVMRPNRTFTFQPDGHLIVESDVAAGQVDYSGNAWPEIVVSLGDHPSGIVDNLYAYGDFAGSWTFGCRLQPSRVPICALYDDTGRTVGQGGRVYETSFWQHAGAQSVFGGEPSVTPALDSAWRVCQHDEPDLWCRDRFRMDLSKDSVTLYVNAVKYFEVTGLPPEHQLPDAFLKGPLYVYDASTIYKPYVDSIGNFPVTRFHWNHFAVNPGTDLTVSPLFCADQPRAICPPFQPKPDQPAPAPLAPFQAPAQPPAAAAPSQPQTPSANGINFADLPNPGRALTGQYPSGTIDWGGGAWYLSGPYDKFTGKSVSFNGEGPTSGTFSFVAPHQLVQLDADNGGDGSATVTLTCDGQNTQSVDLGAHQTTTIKTGWTSACSNVTVTSSNGWYTNFTNLIIN